jgi:phosphoribosyl 1,2-cyclic phosphodiesterase
MLIDCGIGPRIAARRMKELDFAVGQVSAICLTHLDGDHFNRNWVGQIIRREIRVHCHEDRAGDLARLAANDQFTRLIRPFNGKPFAPIDGIRINSIRLEHDEHGSHGFLIEGSPGRIGYATDLGRVDENLIHQFCGVDVLAIESNYDPHMQQSSDRPGFLKQRIMGGRGHLSNGQALAGVRQILDRSRRRGLALPRHIVLLHRSRQCNCPNLLRDLFSRDERIAPRLLLAEQDRPTDWLRTTSDYPHRQLEIDWTNSRAACC